MPDQAQLPLSAIRQPAFLYAPDGRIAAANELAEALAGRSLAGCSAADVIATFGNRRPDGTLFTPEALPPTRALAGEEAIDVPIAITAADGRAVHLLVTASPIRDGDAVTGALVVWQDVSVLEAALAEQVQLRHESDIRAEEFAVQEEELRQQGDELLRANVENDRQHRLLDAILGTIPYRVSLWSREERLLWANERFAADRGLPREAVLGLPYAAFGDRETVVGSLVAEARKIVAGGGPVSHEIEIPGRDGPEYRACTLLPFLADSLLVITEEITDRKRAELEIEQYAKRLRRSNTELERFAYVASHDLQEPLRSIVSFSQLLERRYRGRLDQDADEYIRFIVEGGVRMQSLIRDLLQFSRLESAARDPAPTSAAEAAADALRALAPQLREAGATVTVDDLPAVTADAVQLELIFRHLLGNAVKYRRPEVPLELRVSARREDGRCEFSVADNGIGIEKEYFNRIFVIFQRLHTKDVYPGTGIGLAIVKRIIDRHGGEIRVESTPGEGSTFSFTLPAA